MRAYGKDDLTPAQRRMKIIKYVCDKKVLTLNQLAQKFNVTDRTIQRDINYLSLSYPLEIIRGRHGGVRFIDETHCRQKYLSTEELELLEEVKSCLPLKKAVIVENILHKYALFR